LLVDHDASLLERAEATPLPIGAGGSEVRVSTRQSDLKNLPADAFEGFDVVTASALCDLVSEAWVEAFAARLASAGAAALIALTVDGRRGLTDASGQERDDADDRRMRELFNAHQRRGKGLGRALGPDAASVLPAALGEAGLDVRVERSDWLLAPGEAAAVSLGCSLLEDWARAAAEQSPRKAENIRAWHRARQAALDAGQAGVLVGHVDVLALPKEASA
jgi:hypothetical protein